MSGPLHTFCTRFAETPLCSQHLAVTTSVRTFTLLFRRGEAEPEKPS